MTENNSELLKAADEMIEDFKSISDEDFGALYDLSVIPQLIPEFK